MQCRTKNAVSLLMGWLLLFLGVSLQLTGKNHMVYLVILSFNRRMESDP